MCVVWMELYQDLENRARDVLRQDTSLMVFGFCTYRV
jgi:hypothetical protein